MTFKNIPDEQVIEKAMAGVPVYLSGIRSTGKFEAVDCLRCELRALKDYYKTLNGKCHYSRLTSREEKEFDAESQKYLPALRERTLALQSKYLQGRKVSEINFASASALIIAALEREGLTATVSAQRYRAKVEAPLPTGNTLKFFVRYKDLHADGFIDGIVDSVKEISSALGKLGYGVRVK